MGRWLLILALAGVAAACASTAPDFAVVDRAGPQAVAGLDYAQKHCATCHALGPAGESPNPASTPFRRIINRYSEVELSERLYDISQGHYRMPPLTVTEENLKDLIAYLRTMRERERPRMRP